MAAEDRRAPADDDGLLAQALVAAMAFTDRMERLETVDGDAWMLILGHCELEELVAALDERPDAPVKRVLLPYLQKMLAGSHKRG